MGMSNLRETKDTMENTSIITKEEKMKFLTTSWDKIKEQDHALYIREFYRLYQSEIYNEQKKYFDWTFFLPLREWMSPIEMNVYTALCRHDLYLYPQLPVKNYLIDFADPFAKVAIEVDGREFHKDAYKDIERERIIEKFGWKFYRIWGKDTYDEEALTSFINKIIEENYNG